MVRQQGWDDRREWIDEGKNGIVRTNTLRAAGIVLCGIASVVCAIAIGTVFSQFVDLLRGAIVL